MTKKKEQTSLEKAVLSPEEIKKQAKIINIEQNCELVANTNISNSDSLHSAYAKARDEGSASLYLSLSKLVNYVVWSLAIVTGFLLLWWMCLEWQVTYNDYAESVLVRLEKTIIKLENIFSYILTTVLGFAGGVCKMFLRQFDGNK